MQVSREPTQNYLDDVASPDWQFLLILAVAADDREVDSTNNSSQRRVVRLSSSRPVHFHSCPTTSTGRMIVVASVGFSSLSWSFVMSRSLTVNNSAELLKQPVMWSETVGRRTRPVSDHKVRSWSWCCVVKHGLVTLVVIMILKYTATFQVLFVVSLFCAWNITTVPHFFQATEINSGVYLLKS